VTIDWLEDSLSQGPGPLFPDSAFDLVVIVSSADGIPALRQILASLPASFPAAIAAVHHIGHRASFLPEVLGTRSGLPVRFAADGERLRAACVRMAPGDRHLVISTERRFELRDSEKQNFVRPAGDPLFASAARAFRSRVLGVVLAGMGRDGSAGALEIKQAGGIVIAQDPQSTTGRYMPQAAIENGAADLVLDAAGIASALISLVTVHATRAWLGLPRPVKATAAAVSAAPAAALAMARPHDLLRGLDSA
jgi:two-component system chemotaxis response regulator CheB